MELLGQSWDGLAVFPHKTHLGWILSGLAVCSSFGLQWRLVSIPWGCVDAMSCG